ncbi:pyruvate dehydrogenase E1 component alpha subunit [Prauserella sediminis]|uniref:Pyruvate dehydrogenase E1 component alpha subunit n=1 Tax=Prauserella sediminis TaxID=577680 RepID=A0A839XKS4_9PSEU|nr:thiamine pyrophosphate-dependent dehydrogenase E1 component subunit alpha [Prauserella sediminis]MBB3664512.1 pyruvate dehydrogenase E1 component alpha subunit [Prauserella sediminis]
MTTSLPSPETGAEEGRLLAFLGAMARIRAFETEIARLRGLGTVVGSVHLCSGQEAIYAGAAAALDLPRDLVFPTYRGHGWALACGADLTAMFAELMGREDGVNGGRGGSAYLSVPSVGMMGENSIVGAGAPIASGAALAARFDNSGRVALAAMGDGAVNQGSVHEAFNFAAAMSLPVVFLIENNHWSELTPISATTVSDRLFKRASGYGMPGVRVDGNDPEIVRTTIARAASQAREGNGPTVIEAMTDRIVGHYIGDVQHYREPGELERIEAAEPIARLRGVLVDRGVAEDRIDAILRVEQEAVDAASARAQQSPTADPATALEHLYA